MDTTQPGVALELRGLYKSFGKTPILRGVDLALHAGEKVALIGPNGAGKSTLFNLVSGMYAPSAGQIRLNGQDIAGKRPFEINRLGLSRSFQVSNLFARLSVFDNLRCAVLWGLGYRYTFWKFLSGLSDANQRASELMARIRLDAKRDVPAMDLAYAEQRALEIGITVATGTHVVLLDEPTAGMGRGEALHFVGLIEELTAGKTLLMVEHDMGVVFRLADKVAVLVQGELLAFDKPDAIRADPAVRQAYLGTSGRGDPIGGKQPC